MSDRTVSVAVKAQVGDFVAGIKTAQANLHAFNGELQKSASKRQALSQLGNTAGKVGLVAAAGLGAIVVATANFDKSMSSVRAATHETSGAMEQLRAAALKAGADTAFSATEAAGGIEALAKAGISTADILGGGLTGALDLAAAGSLGVSEAAEIAATALTQFKLKGEDVGHVADLLAAGAGKAQGEVTDMGMALKQSGLVAAQTGLTIEETTGTLAAFASAGLIGSDAGTSFKTMLQSLTPTGAKAAEKMEELNIHAYDAQGNFVGMTKFAKSLQEGLADLSVEQQNAAMKTIFGSDAVRAASVVFQQGEAGISGWIDKVNDSGYAAETAAIKMDNLAGDLEAFKGSLETALIGAGDGTQGPLRDLVQNATELVNAFNGLPPAAKGSVTKTLGAIALLGGGLAILSKMTVGIANTKAAMAELELTSGKTATALKSLKMAGGIAAGMFVLSQAIDAMEKSMDKAAPGIEGFTKSLLDFGSQSSIQGISDDLGDLDKQIQAMDNPDVFASIESFYDKVPGGVGNLTHVIPVLGHELSEADKAARAAAQSFDTIDSALSALVMGGHPEQATDALANLAKMYGLNSDEVETLRSHLPQYDEALAGASNTEKLATVETKKLGGAMQETAADIKAQAKALEQSRKAARETAGSFVGLGDSLNKGKVSLGQWIKDLQKQADALRNFRVNCEKAAKKGLDDGLIASLQEAGPEGALRMKQLANATDAEIKRANKAWHNGEVQIDKYVDAVGGVPKEAGTKLVLTGVQAAHAAIRAIKAELSGIPKVARTDYYVNRINTANKNQAGGRDGDPNTPFFGGGYTGNIGRREVAGVVHGQEFVSHAVATAKFRPQLEAMNAGRMIPAGSSSGRDVAMTAELARLRSTVDMLGDRLARLPEAVRDGAQEGSYHGTEGRFRAQGRSTYMQTGTF